MVHRQLCGQGAPRKISFTWTLATGLQPSQGEQGEPNKGRDGSLTCLLYRLVAEEQKAVPYSLSVQWLCHLGLYKCLYDVHSTKSPNNACTPTVKWYMTVVPFNLIDLGQDSVDHTDGI